MSKVSSGSEVGVSIHTPPWGRDMNIGKWNRWEKFQFTRPRGGAIR